MLLPEHTQEVPFAATIGDDVASRFRTIKQNLGHKGAIHVNLDVMLMLCLREKYCLINYDSSCALSVPGLDDHGTATSLASHVILKNTMGRIF